MAAGELPNGERRRGAHDRRNDRRKAASVRELRMEQRVVLVELFAELVGDHFEAGAQPAGVEGDGRFAAHDSVAFIPPRGVGIAHDFADAFVEQQRLDGAEERKDQLEAHGGNLRAMEAQRAAGLP
jgi:hypothetical protein